MRVGRFGLCAVLWVLATGLAPQALAQAATARDDATAASQPVAGPDAASDAYALDIDGALPGGLLGLGDEGVGALASPDHAPPGPLADSSSPHAKGSAEMAADAPGEADTAVAAPEVQARPAAAHHTASHRRRPHHRARRPQS